MIITSLSAVVTAPVNVTEVAEFIVATVTSSAVPASISAVVPTSRTCPTLKNLVESTV
ncbi:hypothetical protein HOF65_08400 [bacterium]|nr:hypothetical protein [bacterium]